VIDRAGVEYCPKSEDELMRLPRTFSDSVFTLVVLGGLAATMCYSACANLEFANFSSHSFTADEFSVLGLSLGFAPTPSTSVAGDVAQAGVAFDRYMRSFYLADYFSDNDRPSRKQQRKECTRISGVFGENGRNILESVNVPFFLSFFEQAKFSLRADGRLLYS
jgi:hypothetical protein